MTLIVGMKCSDGIVLGADGASTLGDLGQFTARHTTKKLTLIGDKVIVGFSGYTGLGYRVIDRIEEFWKKFRGTNIPTKQFEELCSKELRPMLYAEIQAGKFGTEAGLPGSMNTAICGSILAIPTGINAIDIDLFTITHLGAFDRANDHNSFFTIGSGIQIADPFLRFLFRIYWKDALPNLGGGILTVLWVLQHAIDSNTGGVSEPIQIATLSHDPTLRKHIARELPEAELDEARQQIESFEKKMREFLSPPPNPGIAPVVPPSI